MQKQFNITYLDVILFGLLFNFLQLAIAHDLNAIARYSVFGLLIFVLIYQIKDINVDKRIGVSAIILTLYLIFINLYHYNTLSFLGVSLTLVPLFVLFFSGHVDISRDKRFYKKITLSHFVILFVALYKYKFLLAGADYILNENEVASYSFIMLTLLLYLSDLTKIKDTKYIVGNTLLSFMIAYLMEARAIQFSVIFMILAFLFMNNRSSFHRFLVNLFTGVVLIAPVLMVVYIGDLIDFYADLIEEKLGLPAVAIKSELERFDMFSYIKNKLSKSWFGYGIGNTSYMNDIDISGLHSGSLDLMYWGGYPLFVLFHLFFIYIIHLFLQYNAKYLFAAFIILYYLLLQNYYEGLFFGNMGILLMILSMLTTLSIRIRTR